MIDPQDAATTSAVERWLTATNLTPSPAPGWIAELVRALQSVQPSEVSRNDSPAVDLSAKQAAVLVLLGDGGADGAEVLLQQRSARLRDHPGEVSFPGGRHEDGDRDPVATALREAAEETKIEPEGVDPQVLLPRLVLATGYHVTAVVAYWREPVAVRAVDHGETASVFRMPLARLADPRVRLEVHHPLGWSGPAFDIDGVLIWGYTSEVLDTVLRLGGWERPWAPGEPVELEQAWVRARRHTRDWARPDHP